MGTKRFETTGDFIRHRANARLFCGRCQRVRIVEAKIIMEWFMPPVLITEAQRRLRCRECGVRGEVRMTPIPA